MKHHLTNSTHSPSPHTPTGTRHQNEISNYRSSTQRHLPLQSPKGWWNMKTAPKTSTKSKVKGNNPMTTSSVLPLSLEHPLPAISCWLDTSYSSASFHPGDLFGYLSAVSTRGRICNRFFVLHRSGQFSIGF